MKVLINNEQFKYSVANGFAEVFKDLFGDAGVGARSAVGMNSLPMNQTVEVEMIVEVELPLEEENNTSSWWVDSIPELQPIKKGQSWYHRIC